MRTVMWVALVLVWPAVPGAQTSQAPECAATGRVQFACGLFAPEDLVVVPGEQWVVASAYAGRGGLYLVRASDRTGPVDAVAGANAAPVSTGTQ